MDGTWVSNGAMVEDVMQGVNIVQEENAKLRAQLTQAQREIARLREVCDAAKQVDATWSADEPYPPYMDCVDTDALVGLRTALVCTKEG